MNNLLRGSLFFISGAAIASFVTYKVVEKKFKKIADEEIASVKERYEQKLDKAETDKSEEEIRVVEISEEGVTELEPIKVNPYGALVTDLGYSNNEKEEKEEMVDNNIEIIPPEDFGEYGYKCESLTFYDIDKVLTLDDNTKITDVERYVGPDALNSFGEYEDDSVFVRNHGMKTDFEILLDSRRYSEVVGSDE